MASFHFNYFQSSVPRLADHLIPSNGSAEALDCNFHSGELTSWREPLPTATVPTGTLQTHKVGCCWLPFPMCVEVTDGPILCDDLYITGRTTYPEVATVGANCVPVYSRLGVPCPAFMLAALPTSQADNKDLVKVAFNYQFMNARGKLGQLSPAGDPVYMNDGTPVVLSGWEIPDPSWGVTHVRLSVSVSGYESGREPTNALDTNNLIIADVPINAASFTFTEFFEQLDAGVEEDITRPPPADMRGICRMSSMNCLAGFVGRRVYFSHNNEPDNWPYFMDLDDAIVRIIESQGVIYVATHGRPVVIAGEADCKTASCRSILTHPEAFPMVGREMVALPNGAGYASRNGFVVLSGRNPPSLLTWPLYAPEDWHMMTPESIRPVYHNGFLFLFSDRRSAIVHMAGVGYSGWSADSHSWISDKVTYAMTGGDGELYMLKGTVISRWNAGTNLRPYKWMSPEIVSGPTRNFRAAYVNVTHGQVQFSLRSDDRVIEDRPVNRPLDFTLPSWGTGNRFQLTLTGTGRVKLVSVATSFRELSA